MGNNLRFHPIHPRATLGIWELSSSISFWVIKLLDKKDLPFDFGFIKTGTQDSMKKMPIHALARWAPLLDKIIIFFENLGKKQVGLICPMNKLNNKLVPTSAENGFKVSNIQDFVTMVVFEKWNKFYEFIEQKKEETT